MDLVLDLEKVYQQIFKIFVESASASNVHEYCKKSGWVTHGFMRYWCFCDTTASQFCDLVVKE